MVDILLLPKSDSFVGLPLTDGGWMDGMVVGDGVMDPASGTPHTRLHDRRSDRKRSIAHGLERCSGVGMVGMFCSWFKELVSFVCLRMFCMVFRVQNGTNRQR